MSEVTADLKQVIETALRKAQRFISYAEEHPGQACGDEVLTAIAAALDTLAAQPSKVERSDPDGMYQLGVRDGQRGKVWCKARRSSSPEPQDCDWPFCGCDPHATKVIETLQECGKLASQPAPSGWQQRIAAMSPWTAANRWYRCHFCGAEKTWDDVKEVFVEQPHADDCLWQNAVDALPPAPVIDVLDVPCPVQSCGQPPGMPCVTREAGRSVQKQTPHASRTRSAKRDALPPAPEVKDAPISEARCGSCGHGFTKHHPRMGCLEGACICQGWKEPTPDAKDAIPPIRDLRELPAEINPFTDMAPADVEAFIVAAEDALPPQPTTSDQGDVVCQHGTAMDVHCCNCHSGFLFDSDACVCEAVSDEKVLADPMGDDTRATIVRQLTDFWNTSPHPEIAKLSPEAIRQMAMAAGAFARGIMGEIAEIKQMAKGALPPAPDASPAKEEWTWYANQPDGRESWRCGRCRRVTTFFGTETRRCPLCDGKPSLMTEDR